MIEEGQIADVQREQAARPFFVDHNGDWASFHAFTKADSTAAREPRVREPLQHLGTMILQERLDLLIDPFLGHRPEMPAADGAVAPDKECNRHTDDGSVRVLESVLP
jgi:hypothetical protein